LGSSPVSEGLITLPKRLKRGDTDYHGERDRARRLRTASPDFLLICRLALAGGRRLKRDHSLVVKLSGMEPHMAGR
jgi:hypothetical protein